MRAPLKVIGHWKNLSKDRRLWHPRGFVDPTWKPDDLDLIVHYLKSGFPVDGELGYSFCRFPEGPAYEQMGCMILTDGTWLWPEGLWVYPAMFSVRLPEEFLEHVRAMDYVVPAGMDPYELYSRGFDHSLWKSWCRANFRRPPLLQRVSDWLYLLKRKYHW